MSEIYFIDDRKYKFNILDENTLDFVKKYYNEIDNKQKPNNVINNNKYSINNASFIIKFSIGVIFIFILWDYIVNT